MSFLDLHPLLLAWSAALMVVLIGWMMWPRHKARLESLGRIPLDDDR